MLATACKAIDAEPTSVVDEDTAIYRFRIPLVLLSILDTPEHMSR
jgi:hypothetical protein